MTASVPAALERVLGLSRADGCIALGWEASEADVRWANNTSTTNGVRHSRRLFVISVVGGRVGAVGVTSVDDDRLEDLVRRSEAACRDRPPAEDAAPLVSGDGPSPDWPGPAEVGGAEAFAGLAPGLAEAFGRAGADGIRLFGYAEHTTSTVWLATSAGLFRRHTQRNGRFELNAKTPDYSTSAWVGHAGSDFAGVDVGAAYDRLRQRLAWSATTVALAPGRYTTLLEPSAVADMAFFAYAAGAVRDADEARSVYSRPGGGTRIGERLYPNGIELWSDPAEAGLEAPPFVVATSSGAHASVFDNGLPIERTAWVRDGVLEALVAPRHWAQKAGVRPAPWAGNLLVGRSAGAVDAPGLDAMIASTTGRALLVTCFWYMREVDPQTLLTTGLTRDGVFLVEDGEIKGAVNNFRFNMSPVDALAQAAEVGGAEPTLPRECADWFPSVKAPPLRVERFNMSSVSRAT
ncbi:MAG: metallopeptidase TldD-related protein [Acidimicrobiales bacterium]